MFQLTANSARIGSSEMTAEEFYSLRSDAVRLAANWTHVTEMNGKLICSDGQVQRSAEHLRGAVEALKADPDLAADLTALRVQRKEEEEAAKAAAEETGPPDGGAVL